MQLGDGTEPSCSFLTPRIRTALRLGMHGRRPVRQWTKADVRRYYPTKLTDAELLAVWYLRIERSYVFLQEVIRRKLWRHVLRLDMSVAEAQAFIAVAEIGARGDGRGPLARRLREQAELIVTHGITAYLRQEVERIGMDESKIGIQFPPAILIKGRRH